MKPVATLMIFCYFKSWMSSDTSQTLMVLSKLEIAN